MNFVNVERSGKVATIAINRPERRNALGTDVLEALTGAIGELSEGDDVNVILLTAVAPGFSAGADLKAFSDDDFAKVPRRKLRMGASVRSLPLLEKPVIAAVDGFALGGGLMLAASCDIVVTAPTTRWQLPEVSLGWLPGFGLQSLAQRVGVFAARRLAWGEQPIDGHEAHRLGLADILAGDGETARDIGMRQAIALSSLPPHAVASTKAFFAPIASESGEPLDVLANRMYCLDARHPAAQATKKRFKPR